MIMKICSIWDAKAEAFTQPMFFHSSSAAVRAFADAVNAPESIHSKHPEDYTLFELGAWDEREGKILVQKAPVSLAVGIHLKQDGLE